MTILTAVSLSLIAGLAGMVLPVIAGIFAWLAAVLTTYMLDVVGLFARVPHAHVQRTVSLASMIFLYGLVLATILLLHHKLKAKYVTITDTNIIE